MNASTFPGQPDAPTYLEATTRALAGDLPGPNRLAIAGMFALHYLNLQGIDPMAPIPDLDGWFAPPELDERCGREERGDKPQWFFLDLPKSETVTELRERSVQDVVADLVDDSLKITMRQPHWRLFDPWLDAACRYVSVQPNGGRHRLNNPGGLRPGQWFMAPLPTPLSNPGRHACHCEDCRHESALAGYVSVPVLDIGREGGQLAKPRGPAGYDPDCDGCNRPGGPSPDHTARHYQESAQ